MVSRVGIEPNPGRKDRHTFAWLGWARMAALNGAESLLNLTPNLSRWELRRVHVHVRTAAGNVAKQHAERL
jgi:hypothetical protein